jgi:cytochrome c peroxidase
VRAADEAQKPTVMLRQADLLRARYDLSDRPIPGVFMSGGRRAVQDGVRVKLPQGVTWDALTQMSPDAIAEGDLLPAGFMPLPHVPQAARFFPTSRSTRSGTAKRAAFAVSMSTLISPII